MNYTRSAVDNQGRKLPDNSGGAHGSAEPKPIMGIWGLIAPSGVQGRAPGDGAKPLKLKAF